MTTLFVSDVHLSTERPEIVERFLAFLREQAAAADGLYILGDLFDLWLGDDDDRAPHRTVIAGLRALTDSGVAVHVAHGNHDFLLGSRFIAATGARLLPEPAHLDLYGTRVVALHGDVLCTRDTDYQAFRKMSRDPTVQRQFLALPLEERLRQASSIRHRSQQATRLKPADIMDVTPQAVIDLLRREGSDLTVHGHTHRPNVHQLSVDGRSAARVVLGDWYEQDSVLAWDSNGYRLGRIADCQITT